MSLKQLRGMLEEPLEIPVELNGVLVLLEGRRLSPAERNQVVGLKRQPLAPPLAGRPGEYHWQDPAYQEQMRQANRTARALTVYLGCGWVQADRPGLTAVTEIQSFVEGAICENVLDVLEAGILMEGVSLVERANFTLPAGPATN